MTRLTHYLAGLVVGLGLLSWGGGESFAAHVLVLDQQGRIADVDPWNGSVSSVVDTGIRFTDVANYNGNFYGITSRDFYSIDRDTGAVTRMGRLGALRNADALAIDSEGNAFAMDRRGRELFSIDKLTGAATLVGKTGFRSNGDLAFDGADNLFYSGRGNKLLQLDTTDLASSTVVGMSGVKNVSAIAYVASAMYAITGNELYTLDLETGEATFVAPIMGGSIGRVLGATFTAPAPHALFLFGSGLLALVAFPRRRQTA